MLKSGVKILVLMALALSFVACAQPVYSQSLQQDYEKFSKESSVYGKLIVWLHLERNDLKPVPFVLRDFLVVNAVDLVVSTFCLWLAILLLTSVKVPEPKKYFWLLVAFNIAWFAGLAFLHLIFNMLSFLVLRLRPELKVEIADFMTVITMATAVGLYVWLLARTFSLGFFGALSLMGLSHILYILIFFVFAVATPQTDPLCALLRNNLGLGGILKAYVRDIYQLVSGNGPMALMRLRLFHL